MFDAVVTAANCDAFVVIAVIDAVVAAANCDALVVIAVIDEVVTAERSSHFSR